MRYEVDVNGRPRQLLVHRAGGVFSVSVDGRTWRVDAARVDAQTLSLIVQLEEEPEGGGASHEVVVVADPIAGLEVRVDGARVAAVPNGRRHAGRRESGLHAGNGPQQVRAPMPGKIARVLVTMGETVRARQPLIVIEAMKMENELRAGRDGTVAEIRVAEGASVDAGALLVVVQ
jgi:biotin carboxyl carrier protein